MMKWTKCAIRFLRISRPGVRVPSIAPRKTSTHCVLVFLFCLRDGRGSNRAAAHSAASNQPSGLLLSPRVPTRRNVYRGSCRSKDFMAFLFCKTRLHGFCTVFAHLLHTLQKSHVKCKTDQTCLYQFGLFCHKFRTEKDSEKVGSVGKDENQKGRNLPQRRPDGWSCRYSPARYSRRLFRHGCRWESPR